MKSHSSILVPHSLIIIGCKEIPSILY
nr:unnamed protein product [Callosobruchus analis]